MKIDMDWSPVHLKPLLDYIKKVSEEEYALLSPYIEKETSKPGEVLLKSGATEIESRFILQGMVGKFYLGKLERLYVQGDVCVEMESYSNQLPSRFELKVLQQAKFTRLPYKNANLILEKYPQFEELSEELYRLFRYREEEWKAVSMLPFEQARTALNKHHPGFESILTQKQLADLLGVDRKTITRHNHKEYAEAKLKRIIRYYKSNLKYPFESRVHDEVDKLDAQTLVWGGIIHRLFSGTRDESKYKNLRLTWLSARLYPDASWEKLTWIARLYALLFAMDDFTDQLPEGIKAEVWGEISCGFYGVLEGANCMILPKSIMAYRNAFYELWMKLPKLVNHDPSYLGYLRDEIQLYLKSNAWEAENRDRKVIPTMEDYLIQRPFFSEGQLSISLTPLAMDCDYSEIKDAFIKSKAIRNLAAKLIFITNDLFSYEKEKGVGDFHNLMILKIHHEQLKEDRAREEIMKYHRQTLLEFITQAEVFRKSKSPTEQELLKQIEFKISGAAGWSLYDTSRYHKLSNEED